MIKNIEFQLDSIKTLQFATIDSAFDESKEVRIQAGVNYGAFNNNKVIGCFVQFQFECEDAPFIIIQVACDFKIEDSAWSKFIPKGKSKFQIPEGFARHLAVISVGTVRGVLHEKTNGTTYNRFFLPTINLNNIIKGDVILEFEQED
jgi:hypothetical protein